jgi:hypothetical protein
VKPVETGIGGAALLRQAAIRRLFIVSGLIAVILATAFLLLIFRLPAIRPPEIRLQRLTFSKHVATDAQTILGGTTETSSKEWVAIFEIHNPGQQAISFDWGQVANDFVVLNRDGKRTTPFANFSLPTVLYSFCINHKGTKQLLSVPIPAESKLGRFRIIYWPMTVRDRWQVFCETLKFAEKYPSAFEWVWKHLPDKRRTHQALLEVPLPSDPEALNAVDQQ